jgi:hypothetical protein
MFLASLNVTPMVAHNTIPPTANLIRSRRGARAARATRSSRSPASTSAERTATSCSRAPRAAPRCARAPRSRGTRLRAHHVRRPLAALRGRLLKDVVLAAPLAELPLLAKLGGRQARQLTWRMYVLYDAQRAPHASTFTEPWLASLVFVFGGQGLQHTLMGLPALRQESPAFRASVHQCDEAYHVVMGSSRARGPSSRARPPCRVSGRSCCRR